jgi:hypothetical protein
MLSEVKAVAIFLFFTNVATADVCLMTANLKLLVFTMYKN